MPHRNPSESARARGSAAVWLAVRHRRRAPPCRARRGRRASQIADARIFRTSASPVMRRRIDLIGGNPVDLEFDRVGRLAVDESDALKIFRAHRQVDDHVHRIVEADRDLDIGHRLAVDEIDQAILVPQHAVIVKIDRRVRHREIEAAGFDASGWPESANASSSRGRRAAARGLPSRRSPAASRRRRRASRTPATRRCRPGSWSGSRNIRTSARTSSGWSGCPRCIHC